MSSEQEAQGNQGDQPIAVIPPGPQGELMLVDYAVIVWRRRGLILACAAAGALAALGAHLILPKKYEATTLVLPPQSEDSTMGTAAKLAGLADSLPLSVLAVKRPADRYVEILKSQRVADAIIDRFGLMERYGTDSRVKARELLADKSDFEATKGDLISISVTDRDPQAAAGMANAHAEVLGKIDRELSIGKAGLERRFLDERLVEVEKELKAAQEAGKAFQEKHRIVAVDEGLKATATVIAELEARRMAKEIEVQVMETAYSRTNPQVEMARAELRKLDEKIKEVSKHGVRPGSNPPPATLNPQPDTEMSQWLFPAVENIPALTLEQLDLERRLRLHAELYKLLVTQRDMATLNEAKERSTIQVVAAATASDTPAGLDLRTKLVVTTLLSAVLAGTVLLWQKGKKQPARDEA